MDVDYMNSSQETAQADLVAIMMEMEKLHELSQFPGSPSLVAYYNAGGVSASSSPSLLGGAHAASFCNGQEQYMAPAGMRSTSPTASELSFGESSGGKPQASVAAMREMIFRIAAMQPIHIDPESVKPPKRRNVRISKDPQSVAARHRRERISERIRILQRLVPGGTKMDTASMLEEAIHYMKFLKDQVQTLEQAASSNQQHFSGNSMTTSGSSTEAGYAPDVNRLSVGNYCEAMWDQGFDMNNTTPTTTHMFY